MSFLGIGAPEILVVLLVAFLVLGPNRLVTMAKGLGKTVKEFQNSAGQITQMIEEETEEEPSGPEPPKDSV